MPSGNAARYSVVCTSCLYQRSYPARWEAEIDAAAHRQDNPTHSVRVVEEPQGEARTF
ncbi:MAG: hypothetical protein HYU26_09850 [Candidatus Rokubacteria bacterium]|nr:hypothetical protein [Candidatus Rokubacteria bacterium]